MSLKSLVDLDRVGPPSAGAPQRLLHSSCSPQRKASPLRCTQTSAAHLCWGNDEGVQPGHAPTLAAFIWRCARRRAANHCAGAAAGVWRPRCPARGARVFIGTVPRDGALRVRQAQRGGRCSRPVGFSLPRRLGRQGARRPLREEPARGARCSFILARTRFSRYIAHACAGGVVGVQEGRGAAAFAAARADAVRSVLTHEELVNLAWRFRFKRDAGVDWQEVRGTGRAHRRTSRSSLWGSPLQSP